ncbi:hypothetical protein KUTeg_000142 [Tegillarca granosa]|uniref:DUF3447 domain-containing protein n=1 Tax=Tegillarca granosa TaxID=220873 RepID=A0ABQ9FZS3_TEGGR|nr:hypothetical protein KUTeg_000142 [Tegillarca granosa]
MGQTPLSVAALKGDKRMVDLLIDKFDADICQKNTLNETIFPSLIRYAAVHPERETDMQVMCEHLNNKLQVKFSHGIYCFQAAHDALFDIKMYEITEIDSTPLSVAALKSNTDIVDLLIKDYGADICQKNTLDETIFHSIIKYAAVYPKKESEMIEMCKHLNKHLRDECLEDCKKGIFIWFEKNKDSLTALQLAVSLGTVRLFEFIVNLKDIYCFQADQDGLFDINMYDITEIDSLLKERNHQNQFL